MAVKPIVLYSENEAALRKKSEPVRVMNRHVKKIIRDLKDTLLHCDNGIGLAAPQINIHSRIVAVRLNSSAEGEGNLDPPIALVNPEIVESSREERDFDGCLSFPGLFAETVRPHYLRVKGLDERGQPFDRVFEGFPGSGDPSLVVILLRGPVDHVMGWVHHAGQQRPQQVLLLVDEFLTAVVGQFELVNHG